MSDPIADDDKDIIRESGPRWHDVMQKLTDLQNAIFGYYNGGGNTWKPGLWTDVWEIKRASRWALGILSAILIAIVTNLLLNTFNLVGIHK